MANTKKVTYKFRVQGTGRFPLDMLRYDSCWPWSQEDVRALDGWQDMTGGTPRVVLLEGISEPTEERWASFGWMADAVEKRVS